MQKNLIKLILWTTTITLFSSCSPSGKQLPKDRVKEQISQNSAENKQSLLFFINPAGEPCQVQNQILEKNQLAIEAKAKLIYISTTSDNDRQYFYHYGIRALPIMILVDKQGQIVHRFPPGIIPAEAILSKLSQ